MHITGERNGPPVKVGVAVTDLTTGLYTSNSVMAALFGRMKTGRGQHIDVALSDCQVATLANIASSCLISGKRDTGRWGTSHPSIVPYKAFKTADGDILLGGGNDRLYGVLCNKLGKAEWAIDERFKTNALRVQNRDTLEELIENETRQKTTQELLELLEGSGMRKSPSPLNCVVRKLTASAYAAINDVQDTLNHEHGTSTVIATSSGNRYTNWVQSKLEAWSRRLIIQHADPSSLSTRPSNGRTRNLGSACLHPHSGSIQTRFSAICSR